MSDEGKPSTSSTSSVDELDAFWSRTTIGWHTVYLGLLGLIALLVGSSNELTGRERLAALLVIAVMVLTYLLIGRRILSGEQRAWLGPIQLLVSWGSLYVLLGMGIYDAYFLLFALIPHLWAFLPTRTAVVGTFVFLSGIALVEVDRAGWSVDSFIDVLPQFALQTGLSLLLGLFITGIFVQAEKRAALIDELEQTRAELAQTEHARGALAERERLSYEIHDTLAQGFTSILTLAQAIEVALDRDPGAVRERLALLESTARENLAEARALVGALAPVDLQDASLPEAVERIAARFSRETGLDVHVEIDGEPRPLAASAEVVLLRTAQEALSNVGKHAAASKVSVALRFRPGSTASATIAVVDNGRGFEPGLVAGDGFGLHGMRSRVTQVGGVLEIVSAPGTGTTVRATVA